MGNTNPLSDTEIKGIIFDYGGTIDTRGDHWSHVIREGWRRAGVEADDETFRVCYVEGERALARERIILPGDNFSALMDKKLVIEFRHLAMMGGIDSDEIEAKARVAAGYCYEYAHECVAEAAEVLKRLAERYPMVLVSNFYGNVDEVIRDFGIRKYFQGIIESAVVGVRKPDARIFRLGVVALGLNPDEVLVVGDSLRKDILPARSIGCKTAWIKGRGWDEKEDALTDEAQIPALSTLLS
ncbi:MAG: HAD family hydrolase [Muribaculaceae bacterium]|nr:HAD family hydrolase [Muribaculaceae bacterium]